MHPTTRTAKSVAWTIVIIAIVHAAPITKNTITSNVTAPVIGMRNHTSAACANAAGILEHQSLWNITSNKILLARRSLRAVGNVILYDNKALNCLKARA